MFQCDTRITGDGVLTDAHSADLLRDLLIALALKTRP